MWSFIVNQTNTITILLLYYYYTITILLLYYMLYYSILPIFLSSYDGLWHSLGNQLFWVPGLLVDGPYGSRIDLAKRRCSWNFMANFYGSYGFSWEFHWETNMANFIGKFMGFLRGFQWKSNMAGWKISSFMMNFPSTPPYSLGISQLAMFDCR